jgi:hypothetical protein
MGMRSVSADGARSLSQYATGQREAQGRGTRSAQWEYRRRKIVLLLISLSGFVIHFFETGDLIGLGSLGSLDDVELNFISLLEALVSLALDRAVVNEDIGATLAPEEAVALRIVEPLNGALILCQWSNSLIFLSEPGTGK